MWPCLSCASSSMWHAVYLVRCQILKQALVAAGPQPAGAEVSVPRYDSSFMKPIYVVRTEPARAPTTLGERQSERERAASSCATPPPDEGRTRHSLYTRGVVARSPRGGPFPACLVPLTDRPVDSQASLAFGVSSHTLLRACASRLGPCYFWHSENEL